MVGCGSYKDLVAINFQFLSTWVNILLFVMLKIDIDNIVYYSWSLQLLNKSSTNFKLSCLIDYSNHKGQVTSFEIQPKPHCRSLESQLLQINLSSWLFVTLSNLGWLTERHFSPQGVLLSIHFDDSGQNISSSEQISKTWIWVIAVGADWSSFKASFKEIFSFPEI